MVCATSTSPRLAYTVSSPNKVGLHLTFQTVWCSHAWYCRIALLVAIEYAWNTYPSTNRSSLVLLVSHLLLLLGVFFGYPTGIPRRRVAFKKELVETEPERVTATEDDSGTDSVEEYGDASDRMGAPPRRESRAPGEREKAEKTMKETLSLNRSTEITALSELDMMVLDDSSL